MGRHSLIVRLLLEMVYLLVGFGFLRYFYAGESLCNSSLSIMRSVLLMTAIIGCLDTVASGLAWAVSLAAKERNLRFLPIVLATGFVVLTLCSYLYLMSDGDGVLRLDPLFCYEEEAYEIGLLFLVAPFFVLLTLAREFAVLRLANTSQQADPPVAFDRTRG